jgi:hypothetical protein
MLTQKDMDEIAYFLYDISSNYDHDNDAHKYRTRCRACEAEKLLLALKDKLKGKDEGGIAQPANLCSNTQENSDWSQLYKALWQIKLGGIKENNR